MLAKELHFLPIAAFVFSISGNPWIHHYVQARRGLQLRSQAKLDGPFLPGLANDTIDTTAVTSSTITKVLRELFQDQSLRSHFLKHTLLSFAAKGGFDPHIRKLLRYHLDRHEVTLATYSRDLLAEPLRQLKSLLLEIQSGEFLLDTTRSGYFPAQDRVLPVQLHHEHVPEQVNSAAEPLQVHPPKEHEFCDSEADSSSTSSLERDDPIDEVPDMPAPFVQECSVMPMFKNSFRSSIDRLTDYI